MPQAAKIIHRHCLNNQIHLNTFFHQLFQQTKGSFDFFLQTIRLFQRGKEKIQNKPKEAISFPITNGVMDLPY